MFINYKFRRSKYKSYFYSKSNAKLNRSASSTVYHRQRRRRHIARPVPTRTRRSVDVCARAKRCIGVNLFLSSVNVCRKERCRQEKISKYYNRRPDNLFLKCDQGQRREADTNFDRFLIESTILE